MRNNKIRIRNFIKNFLIGAVGIAAIFIIIELFLTAAPRRPEISFEAPENAVLGDVFPITVMFTNNSETILRDIKVSLTLPSGVIFSDGKNGVRKMREVGIMDMGEIHKEIFNVSVLDASSAEQTFRADVSYLPATLNKSLTLSRNFVASVEKPVTMTLNVPKETRAGEEFNWSVAYENMSDKDWTILLSLTAPKDFSGNFSQAPIVVKAREKGETSFTGIATLPDNSVFNLRVQMKGLLKNREYVIEDMSSDVTIKTSPLSLKIFLGAGSDGAAVRVGDKLRYRLVCSNLSDTAFKNVVIKTNFQGDMYDLSGIEANGLSSVKSGTVFWNYAIDPGLAVIGPGESREIEIGVPLKAAYQVRRVNDKNFTVKMTANVESSTGSSAGQSVRAMSVASLQSKLAGDFKIETRAYFRDADSGIINEGTLPLRVAAPTDFTVHWLLSSYATDMSGVEVKAALPIGVSLTGKQTVTIGELNFDPVKREVFWKIPKVLANTGIMDKPLEAVFQVRATPIDEFIGSYVPLLRETRVSGTDDFTGLQIAATGLALNSSLSGDPTVSPLDGLVEE